MQSNLSAKYEKALHTCRNSLIEDLCVDDIIYHLRTDNTLKKDDLQKITRQTTDSEKCSVFLDIIKERGDPAFEKFMELLREESEWLAKEIDKAIDHSLSRVDDILIKGSVPYTGTDYNVRDGLKRTLINTLMNWEKKPILVSGGIGCGKTTLVIHALHSEKLYIKGYNEENFLKMHYDRVIWMTIGNIKKDEILSKLLSLNAMFDYNIPTQTYQTTESLKGYISYNLRRSNTLLILDDIQDSEIMKYFTFSVRFIVTTRNNNLLSDQKRRLIEVPDTFTEEESSRFVDEFFERDQRHLKERLIDLSKGNPLYLSLLRNMLLQNEDYINQINNDDFQNFEMNEVIEPSIDTLPLDIRSLYDSLIIINKDTAVSLSLVAIYWSVTELVALQHLNTLCKTHFMTNTMPDGYTHCLYKMHISYWDYLDSKDRERKTDYQRTFIATHVRRFTNWLDFDLNDPYFFLFCGRILKSLEDYVTLIDLFTDFTFLAAKIVLTGISDLLYDYETHEPSTDSEIWNEFKQFFMRHHYLFVQLPGKDKKKTIQSVFTTLIQLAIMEKETSEIFIRAKQSRKELQNTEFWVWENSVSSLKIWEARTVDTIDLIDINHCGILVMSMDKRLSFYDISSGQCIFCYKLNLQSKVILCKFKKIDGLEFVIITETGIVRCFDISRAVKQRVQLQRLQSGNDEYDDEVDDSTHKDFDFKILRGTFWDMNAEDFVKKSEITPSTQLGNISLYLIGTVGCDKIIIARSDEERNVENPTIGVYEEVNHNLTTVYEYQTNFKVKKMIQTTDDTENEQFVEYIMSDDGSKIHRCSNWGNDMEPLVIGTKVINDFVVVGADIYMATNNDVYKNLESIPLFSTSTNAVVTQISMCHHNKMMALCLKNQSVQIWNVDSREMLYSLKGFDWTGAQFHYEDNNLITIGQSNIAKWSIDSVNHQENVATLNSNYRSLFCMHAYSPACVIWVCQRYNNLLEFITIENGEKNISPIQASSAANCMRIDGNYAFIGFRNSHLQIFDLMDMTNQIIIDSVRDVREVAIISRRNQDWDIFVNFETDKIKTFKIKMQPLSVTSESSILALTDLLKKDSLYSVNGSNIAAQEVFKLLKMFKITPDKVFIGWCLNHQCVLYCISDDFSLEKKPFFNKSLSNDKVIKDFDLNDNGKFLCVSTNSGLLKIWNTNNGKATTDRNYDCQVFRICKFRPTFQNQWNVVAIITDNGVIRLFYFLDFDSTSVIIEPRGKPVSCIDNIIVEDVNPGGISIFSTLTWTSDGRYLVTADNYIKKWEIAQTPKPREKCRLPMTKLYTHSGGIRCIGLSDDCISTIDLGGYFYIFRRI